MAVGAMNIISLGAGVQSTTMLLMAMHGEIEPMPDCAIFADTGWEPQAVYDHLAWLEKVVHPFPIHQVVVGNIRDDMMAAASGEHGAYVSAPLYLLGSDGKKHMGRRSCTREYKLSPLRKAIRILSPGRTVTNLWIGISLDEVERMKDSPVRYIRNRWPLIEQRITRGDCLAWMEKRGYPRPPRSACIGCPLRSNAEWSDLRAVSDEWADAVHVDHAIRKSQRLDGEAFLHRSFQPLDMVDLRTEQEKGQLDLWGNECEGMCGL